MNFFSVEEESRNISFSEDFWMFGLSLGLAVFIQISLGLFYKFGWAPYSRLWEIIMSITGTQKHHGQQSSNTV